MKNQQFARIGKITPTKQYMDSSEMKERYNAVREHSTKTAENIMK